MPHSRAFCSSFVLWCKGRVGSVEGGEDDTRTYGIEPVVPRFVSYHEELCKPGSAVVFTSQSHARYGKRQRGGGRLSAWHCGDSQTHPDSNPGPSCWQVTVPHHPASNQTSFLFSLFLWHQIATKEITRFNLRTQNKYNIEENPTVPVGDSGGQ